MCQAQGSATKCPHLWESHNSLARKALLHPLYKQGDRGLGGLFRVS